MKNFIGNFTFLIITLLILQSTYYSQNSYNYGPVRENQWHTIQGSVGYGPTNQHYIGVNAGGPIVTYILFVNWQWNNSDITKLSQLTSINLKFSAYDDAEITRDFHFSIFNVKKDGVNTNDKNTWPSFYEEIKGKSPLKVYEDLITADNIKNSTINYEKTITSGALFEAVNEAITSGNNYITLALRSEITDVSFWIIYPYGNSSTLSTTSPSIDLTLNFASIPQNFQFANKIENTENYGLLNVKNNGNGTSNNINSGTVLGLDPMLNYTARTNELPFAANWNSTGNTEKHNYWINENNDNCNSLTYSFTPQQSGDMPFKLTSIFDRTYSATIQTTPSEGITGTIVSLKDPWYYYSDAQNNWYQTDEFKNYTSPLIIQNKSSNSYGGVFLNQIPTGNNPYYSVSFPSISSNQSININGTNHRIYFIDWSVLPSGSATLQNPNSIFTPVVFNNEGATVTANIKGSLISNKGDAFSNTSQRKFVRTDNGYLHLVYESMNHIWYERSTDNGSNWQIMNGGKYLDQGASQSKLPSITTMFNEIAIVYQEEYAGWYNIMLARFDENSIKRYTTTVYSCQNDQAFQKALYTTNADPVIAFNEGSMVLVCWKREIPEDPTSSGIWYKLGVANVNPGGLLSDDSQWFQESMIPGTTINSFTPTVALSLLGQEFALAWEQREYYGSIKFARLYYGVTNGVYTVNNITQETISNFSYYQKHYKPSLAIINHNSGGGKLELGWVGERTYYENGVQKVMKNALYRRDTYSTSTNTWNWSGGSMALGSSSVTAVNVNTTNNDGVVGWNEGGVMNRYVRTSNLYSTRTFNTGPDLTGVSLQVNNSPDFNSMYALVFKNSTLPYCFTKSNSIAVLGKTGPDAPSSRIAVARLDSAVFYISSRLTLDGKSVGFSTKSDSIKSYDVKSIGEVLSTLTFTPEAASSLSYEIGYGTLDTLFSMKALSKAGDIQCRLELQDESNGSTLKVLEKFSLDKLTMKGKDGSLRSLSGSIDVKKFAGRSLRLRLVIEDGINARWGLMERVLSPEDEKEIKKITSEKVMDYALSQNYPNPFNPSTVISYEIPRASKVSLKIYDMLGREVTTLVDEVKGEGRYSVEFNASSLPSGIYIYEIRANDFVRNGKMMLLK